MFDLFYDIGFRLNSIFSAQSWTFNVNRADVEHGKVGLCSSMLNILYCFDTPESIKENIVRLQLAMIALMRE